MSDAHSTSPEPSLGDQQPLTHGSSPIMSVLDDLCIAWLTNHYKVSAQSSTAAAALSHHLNRFLESHNFSEMPVAPLVALVTRAFGDYVVKKRIRPRAHVSSELARLYVYSGIRVIENVSDAPLEVN
eukprot:m.294556 g.294556  ORF g.294556 m.294556 type:complete len:127 (+) comp40750_c0_seq38:65-445(+)